MTLDVDVDTSMSTEDSGDGSQTVSQTTEVTVGGSVSLDIIYHNLFPRSLKTKSHKIIHEIIFSRNVGKNMIYAFLS